MSLSNPNANGHPNPSSRWFEWSGQDGVISYYDKEEKKQVFVTLPFTFILMDELSAIKGWHIGSDSGIYSNEVRNISEHVLTVKTFKKEVLAEGLYKEIKERIKFIGAHFTANLYVAFKRDNGVLDIGIIRFKGAALGSWMEFRKNNRYQMYKDKAIRIEGFTEGKKGAITYRMPKFSMTAMASTTIEAAIELDRTLQVYFNGYFSRKQEQSQPVVTATGTDVDTSFDPDVYAGIAEDFITDDDIPF